MGKQKLYEVVINVSMPSTMADWIDEMVTSGKFSSRSHGIRRCVGIAMSDPEVKAKL